MTDPQHCCEIGAYLEALFAKAKPSSKEANEIRATILDHKQRYHRTEVQA